MNKLEIQNIAQQSTPKVKIKFFKQYLRHEIINERDTSDCIGIELGVAGGHYSQRMMGSGRFRKFYGVDIYEDHHNTKEYIGALKTIGLEKNYCLLRMSFDEAIDLFDDAYFDFIYFDGYAHTGEEGGKTFSNWFKKLKVGGMFAGDDYHDDWPLVKWAVNDMVTKIGCDLNVTIKTENTYLNRYPTWFFIKEKECNFTSDTALLKLGTKIRNSTRKKASSEITLTIDQISSILKQVKLKQPKIANSLKKLL